MEKNWGKRCKEYNADCACCKAWLCYDFIFQYAQKPELTVEFELKRIFHSNWKEEIK